MNHRSAPWDEKREEEAAGWVLRLQDGEACDEVSAEWLAWCDADERNRQAFDRMAELWRVTGSLVAERRSEEPASSPARNAIRWVLPLAASLLLAAFTAVFVMMGSSGQSGTPAASIARFETPIGVTRTATLSDGSKVEIGGRTSLVVNYSDDRRLVVAEEGEAFFEVAKNAERPFVVEAGPLTATAVGTSFLVERSGNTVVVSVREGIVEIRTMPEGPAPDEKREFVLRATAGDRVRFDRGELVQSAGHGRQGSETPWAQGRLEFRDEPLRFVIARVNRYSDLQLEISDPAISDLRVTATIDPGRVDSWLKGIEMVLPVRVSRQSEKLAIISPIA